jgi:hypothetical protein
LSEFGGGLLPGVSSKVRFQWNDKKPPLYWSILAFTFVLTLFLWLGFDFIVPHIGSRVADFRYSRAVPVYGGTYYVQAWAAWFRDSGGWIPGLFFAALMWIQSVKGRYVPRDQ